MIPLQIFFSRVLFSMTHPSLHHSAAYIDDTLRDVIGCYGYDVNSAGAAAQEAKDKDQLVTTKCMRTRQ